MSVSSKLLTENKQFIISIDERFDFSLHQCFRDSYSGITTQDLTYTLDLSQTDYMDSSALGMILLLKDHVQLYAGQLVISRPSETVKQILEIAQFHRLMRIE